MRYTPRRTRFLSSSPGTVVCIWPSPFPPPPPTCLQHSHLLLKQNHQNSNETYGTQILRTFVSWTSRLWTYWVGFLWKVCLVFAAERRLQPTVLFQFRDSNQISKEIISFQIKNIIRLRWSEGLQVIPWTLWECSELDIESIIVSRRIFLDLHRTCILILECRVIDRDKPLNISWKVTGRSGLSIGVSIPYDHMITHLSDGNCGKIFVW